MTESASSRLKLDPMDNKYIFLNPAGVFEPTLATKMEEDDDLLLKQHEEGIFSILNGGKQIIKYLDKLTNNHGISLVLYSDWKERRLIHTLEGIVNACKRERLEGFPRITAMIVRDGAYLQVRTRDSRISESRSNELLKASRFQSHNEPEILTTFSKIFQFSKFDYDSLLVLDNRDSFVSKLKQEGWNACDVSKISLRDILLDFYKGVIDSQPSDMKQSSMVLENGPIDKGINSQQATNLEPCLMENEDPQENVFVSDYQHCNQSSCQYDDGQRYTEGEEYAPLAITIKSLTQSSPQVEEAQSHSLRSLEAKKINEVQDEKMSKSRKAEDFLPYGSWISNLKFGKLKKKVIPFGSSGLITWLTDEENMTEWIGKVSMQSLYNNDSFQEYKEYLASIIYKFFGVTVPKTVLAEQVLDERYQNQDMRHITRNLDKAWLHVISNVIPGFELVGPNFVKQYKRAARQNKNRPFCVNEGTTPLIGFGKLMAVAILIDDYDFIGNAGKNLGYIPKENGKYFEIVKIDPGEALTPEEDLIHAPLVHNPLGKKGAVLGTFGDRIDYEELNEFDQKEFVQTLFTILKVTASTMEKIFASFFETDKRFRKIFFELQNRRIALLAAFAQELEYLIYNYLSDLDEMQAQKYMTSWGQPIILRDEWLDQLAEHIRDKSQLEALAFAKTAVPAGVIFQASMENDKFVGRDSELQQIEKLLKLNTGLSVCVIVGGPGLGKTQLATEFICRNHQEMYSKVFWIDARSGLIFAQIQTYLEICYGVTFNTQKTTQLVRKFYQMLAKDASNPINGTKKPCVVFDRAESMAEILAYIPRKRSFPRLKIDILITSRYTKWGKPFHLIIELKAFDIEDTKNYIRKCFPRLSADYIDKQLSCDAKRLTSLFGGLPLAISREIAYIQQKGGTISQFCNQAVEECSGGLFPLQFEQEPKKEQELQQIEVALKRAANHISTLLTLVFVELRRKNPIIETILDVLAYLSPKDTNKKVLREAWKWSHEGIRLEDFEEAFEYLVSYSIITFEPIDLIRNQLKEKEDPSRVFNTTRIKPHQFTQQVIRLNHLRSGIGKGRYLNALNWVLKQLDYDERDVSDILRAKLIVEHGIYLEGLRNSVEFMMDELLNKIGSFQLYAIGNYSSAKLHYQKALMMREDRYGADHTKYSETLIDLGNAYGSSGNYRRQKALQCKALKIYEKHLGSEDLQIGYALLNLSNACAGLGEHKAQKDFLTRALKIFQMHYDKEHIEIGKVLSNLGNAWGALGNYQEQKKLLSRALQIKEKYYGKTHVSIAQALTNLSNALENLEDYEGQKNVLSQARKIFVNSYGESHPQVGITLIQLGNACENLKDSHSHKDFLSQALIIFENLLEGAIHNQDDIALGSLLMAIRALNMGEKINKTASLSFELPFNSPREALSCLRYSLEQKLKTIQTSEINNIPQGNSYS